MIIYKTTNLINNKIYIGQSTKDDYKYKGSGTYLKNAFKKYGKKNFKKEIIEILPYNATQDDLNEAESKWILFYKSNDHDIGYNLMEKSGQNGKFSTETRLKMSKSRMGKEPWNKGLLGFQSGENHPLYGIGHSDESRLKMSKSRMGKEPWNKGKEWNEETKEKMKKPHKHTKRCIYVIKIPNGDIIEIEGRENVIEIVKCSRNFFDIKKYKGYELINIKNIKNVT